MVVVVVVVVGGGIACGVCMGGEREGGRGWRMMPTMLLAACCLSCVLPLMHWLRGG